MAALYRHGAYGAHHIGGCHLENALGRPDPLQPERPGDPLLDGGDGSLLEDLQGFGKRAHFVAALQPFDLDFEMAIGKLLQGGGHAVDRTHDLEDRHQA